MYLDNCIDKEWHFPVHERKPCRLLKKKERQEFIFFFLNKCFLLLRAWLCKNAGVPNSTLYMKWANVLHYFPWSLHPLKTVCTLFSVVVFKGQESAIKTRKYVATSVAPQWHDLTLGWELGTLLYNFMVLGLSVPVMCGVGGKFERLQVVAEREVSEMSSLKYRAFPCKIPGW